MKITKRIMAGALAAVMSSALLLAGCGKEETAPRYDYDLSQYLKLDSYKGIEVEEYAYTVTDEDVQREVLLARSSYATVAEKQDAIVESDQVNIDYVGYMDGETFAGGSATDTDLTIGSGSFIDGFESGLIGAKAGDTVTLDMNFPDPYLSNTALSGKAVQFVVTINKVYEQALPAYTDAFVQEHYGYETVEAFEQAIYDSLAEQYESNSTGYMLQEMWGVLMDKTEIIKYPETEYNELYNESIAYYTGLAEEENITLNEYVANTYSMSVEEFTNTLETSVDETIKQEMIIYYIARQENISVTDEDYKTRGEAYAEYYGLDSLAALEEYFTPAELRESIFYDMVNEFLLENAVIKQAE